MYTRTGQIFHQAIKSSSAFTLTLVISASFALTAVAQPSLGTSALLEGPGSGSDSVVLAMAYPTDTWTATANDAWLHLSVANQSGTGSTNVVFSYDVNPGVTRTGTLTVAGQTLTVTQAGSSYVPAPGPVTALVASGLNHPTGVAVDSMGNVYFADSNNNAIKKWTAANNTVTTLVASGLNEPDGVAVDGAGNVYFADTPTTAIKEWTAANNTVTTLVSAGLNYPVGVAVDGAGNVYIADYLNNAIKKWTAANRTVSTLVGSGLSYPEGVAVDVAGNVYIADSSHKAIKVWTAAKNTVTTLATSGLNSPIQIAVDGAGNVYCSDVSSTNAIKEWTPASRTVTTLVSAGLSYPNGVAADGAGNVYIADSLSNAINELPHAFMDPTAKSEGPSAGSDTLPVVLPATANLLAPFAPTSDQPWLTITGITNGVVSFAFGGNATGTNRTAHITLLGQAVAITQATAPVVITSQPASLTLCAGSPATFTVTALGDSLAYQWQVSQDGGNTFTNISDTATNASYTNLDATLADNGNQYQVIVTGTVFSATSAPPAVLTVNAPATASAGANQTIGAGSSTAPLGGSIGGGATGGLWATLGTGTFTPNATALNATYTPSVSDSAAGAVTLTLTSSGSGAPCTNATAQVVVTIEAPPAVVAAPTNLTVCAGSSAVFSVGATGGGLTYQWQVSQDGGMTFTNLSSTATNASYTNLAPTVADNGNQYQVIVSARGVSVTSAPPAVLTVYASATASAGGNQTICAGNSTLGLGGAVGGAATGGAWSSSGTGSFVPDATTLSAVYSPSAADIAAGTVTLTLNATGQLTPCPASAQVAITINMLPAIATQPTNLTVCAGSPAVFSVGATGTGLTYQWQVSQDGGMTFTNLSNTATNASYTNAGSDAGGQRQPVSGYRQWRLRAAGDFLAPSRADSDRVVRHFPGHNRAPGRAGCRQR